MTLHHVEQSKFSLWRPVPSLAGALAAVLTSPVLAQVRPPPMGGDYEFLLGREWIAYFIGGFFLLIFLFALRSTQKRKKGDQARAKKHHQHMEKLKEERRQAIAAAKPSQK